MDGNGNLWTTGFWSSQISEVLRDRSHPGRGRRRHADHGAGRRGHLARDRQPRGRPSRSSSTGPATCSSARWTAPTRSSSTRSTRAASASNPSVPPVTYFPPPDNRGTDWLDLAFDQNTMFYTSESNQIHAFTLDGAAAALRRVAAHRHPVSGSCGPGGRPVWLPVNKTAFAFRLLPPGDAVTGGFLVATYSNVYQVDVNGHILRGFSTAPGADRLLLARHHGGRRGRSGPARSATTRATRPRARSTSSISRPARRRSGRSRPRARTSSTASA